MSTDLSTQKSGGKLRAWLQKSEIRSGINDALGGWMDSDAFLAQIVIFFQKPEIAECTPESQFEAAHMCAMLGMLPNLQQVAIIPRKIGGGQKQATVMPQWQGYQALMMRSPDVLDVTANLVHVSDTYKFEPAENRLYHEYDPFDDDRTIEKLDDLKGGYLVVKFRDRSRPDKYHFVSKKTIQKARACAQADNIWKAWFQEQCLKTVFRNAYARRVVPIDPLVNSRLEQANNAEDAALGNDPMRGQEPLTRIEHQPTSRAQQAKQRLGISSPQQPDESPEEIDHDAEPADAVEGEVFDAAAEFLTKIAKCHNIDAVNQVYTDADAEKNMGDLSTEDFQRVADACHTRTDELEGT